MLAPATTFVLPVPLMVPFVQFRVWVTVTASLPVRMPRRSRRGRLMPPPVLKLTALSRWRSGPTWLRGP
jgi:hypothetical protein